MQNSSYILQNMQQVTRLKFLFSNDDVDWYFEKEKDEKDISLDNLLASNNKHYLIVAEPGYGKTRLLKEIMLQSKDDYQGFFLDAKKIKQSSIEESLKKCKNEKFLDISEEKLQKLTVFKNTGNDFSSTDKTIICIDAVDEVAVFNLHELLEKIEEFIENNKEVKIFLSCRIHHIKKVSFGFEDLDFKFITLHPFNGKQIEQFLKNSVSKEIDLDSIYKKSKISNLFDFISIPRYLYYFCELLKDGSIQEVINLSRAKMFEHFIYRKLNKELQKNTLQSQIDLLKRVLEKLAFIMKLDGVSEITKDELMTIFDKMGSNFSQIAFRDDLIQKLYDRSLIKDNIETIEFENQEFLDYLSAKELARFEKSEQVFFDIAIEPHILELYPSWFYVLPFIFELKPKILELFFDFLDKNSKKALSSEYFKALLNIEPETISYELKSKIFDMVFDYYTSHTKYFDAYQSNISRKLSRYYDDSKYQKILDSIADENDSLTVLGANAVQLISLLIENQKLDNKKIKYWQKKVSKWLKYDVKKFRHLHRNIVGEFDSLCNGDFEWIKKHRFIFEKGIQIQDEYARACFKVAPNDTFSIDVYLDVDKYWKQNKNEPNLIRSNDEYDHILKLSTSKSMIYALDKIWKDELYHHRFCENLNERIYKETKINWFKENLLNINDDELLVFLKELIMKSMDDSSYHSRSHHGSYQVFIEVILQKDKGYIKEYIYICKKHYETEKWHYYHSFLDYISIKLVADYFDVFIKAIEGINDEKIRFNMLEQIYYKSPLDSELKMKITSKYPDLISTDTNKMSDYEKDLQKKTCSEWTEKIKPEPKKFMTDLFEFFTNTKEALAGCQDYKKNYKDTVIIAKDMLKNSNPLNGKIEKKENGSAIIWQVNYYHSCIVFAHKENIDLEQDAIDNVFRYLPFNINSDYETTLAVAKEPSKQAIQDVINVYAGKRDDDLGTYHVRQFTELYNKMKLTQFEPVLLEMLKNDDIEEHEKVYIVQSLPISVLTKDIINENRKLVDKDSTLYQEYLATLIRKYTDKSAINEAFKWIKERAETVGNKDRFFDSLDVDENNIAISMANVDYNIKRDKEMLILSSKLSEKNCHTGSSFLKNVVKIHLEYLIKNKSNAHEVILDMEKFLDLERDKKDLHWFEYRLQELKQVYLNIVKKSNIVSAIKKYNQLQIDDYLPISSTFELRELVKDVIEKDIKIWIEDEGAYKHIQELSKKEKNTNAEDFIQKSIKAQIELALIKRGFRDTDFSIIREEQLLDDKRLDFTVRYGLIGSIMIELKLAHNSEAKPTIQKGKIYPEKLKKYMSGSKSDYGLFVIFKVKDEYDFDKQMIGLHKLYENKEYISVLGLSCV